MAALNYDANKLPLGKLSENTLRKGNSVLKDISDVIGDATLAIKKFGGSRTAVLATLTSQYYTIIPHAFGRQVPPVIDTLERLKREAELVESLGEMEIATEIISNVSLLYSFMLTERLRIYRSRGRNLTQSTAISSHCS
jgi:poly [ADP-ribose] polymerase 2/3/4